MELFDTIVSYFRSGNPLAQWSLAAGYFVIAILVGVGGVALVFHLIMRKTKSNPNKIAHIVLQNAKLPAQIFVPALIIKVGLELFDFPEKYVHLVTKALPLVVIFAIGVSCSRIVFAVQNTILYRQDITASDNLRQRKAATQIRVLSRVLHFLIWVFVLSAMLLSFDAVQEIGVSLLASAGITGIIVGFAAQKTLGNIIAGIQIALTQPIRIDDVVIVEGEWGRIEEITLTFVVVRIWDLRRLVLPIQYFIEKPFQNWTRVSADILGSVFLYTDYTLSTDIIRKETKEIVSNTALWDEKVCVVQVTSCSEKTVETRILLSAKDSSTAWELRCLVREKLLAKLNQEYPQTLPRLRATLQQQRSEAQPGSEEQNRNDQNPPKNHASAQDSPELQGKLHANQPDDTAQSE